VTFSPRQRTFTDALEVTLLASVPGAVIHYTMDDTAPGEGSPRYGGPLRLTGTTMLRAVAIDAQSGAGVVQNQSFVRVAPDVLAFSSNLPLVLLHTPGTRPMVKAETLVPGSITTFEPEADTRRASFRSIPAHDGRMGIRIRGSTSAEQPKKSYKVETWGGAPDDQDQNVPLLGLPADSDWVFYAPYRFDLAFIRNAVMFSLSRQLGHWAPRTRYVEVFLADRGKTVSMEDYVGVYVVIEKVKRGKQRLAIANLGPRDNDDASVTGGYIFRFDRLGTGEKGLVAGQGPGARWTQECPAGVATTCRQPSAFVLDDPGEKDITPAQHTYLKRTLDDFANRVAGRQAYDGLIDVASFIDHHIMQTFSKNPDALMFSAFFHKDRGQKLRAGPLWDLDRTLGVASDPRVTDPRQWDGTPVQIPYRPTNVFNFGFWGGLLRDPAFSRPYWQRWNALLVKELGTANLHALVDAEAAALGPEAPARDVRRWPQFGPRKSLSAPLGSGTHADEVQIMKAWISARVAWIHTCLGRTGAGGPESCP